jgi:Immunity protein 31
LTAYSATAAKFQFYEVVRVLPISADLAEIHGETGAILGLSEHGEPEYEYGIFIERDGHLWSVAESDLESTGVFLQRSDFYDDNVSIRVQVDEQGRGTLAD